MTQTSEDGSVPIYLMRTYVEPVLDVRSMKKYVELSQLYMLLSKSQGHFVYFSKSHFVGCFDSESPETILECDADCICDH